MEILTYSLRRENDKESEPFYKELERFADDVLERMEAAMLPAAEAFRRYILHSGAEPLRTAGEYAFELLALGVLWRIYAPAADRLQSWQGQLLRRLVRLRTESAVMKPAADRLRGLLGSRWLASSRSGSGYVRPGAASSLADPEVSLHLDRLLLWLEASGEFRQEAARFRLWSAYLRELDREECRKLLRLALDEAVWFEAASLGALGRYTQRVDHYRLLRQPPYNRREDAVLRSRRRVEYHLNLAGAELMNRAYRAGYAGTPRKAVLLPVCMKAHAGTACAAVRGNVPHRCLLCSAGCRVGQIEKLARSHSFEVIIVPHESDAFSREAVARLVRERTGIVGVACALNLIAGGWQAKACGIPAQCVILDYCGCKAHWDSVGFPTDLNLDRLCRILGLEPPTAPPVE